MMLGEMGGASIVVGNEPEAFVGLVLVSENKETEPSNRSEVHHKGNFKTDEIRSAHT